MTVPDLTPVPDPTVDTAVVPNPVPLPPHTKACSNSASSRSSGTSDDNIIVHHIHRSVMPNIATVEDQNPKIPPTLTGGTVTPEVLHQWERTCEEYFRVKHVAQGKQVESVLSHMLKDLRIADWAEANESVLVGLKFPKFMDRLRAGFRFACQKQPIALPLL